MENTFDHAKAYLDNFLKSVNHALDYGVMVKIMTDWASHFGVSTTKEAINEVSSSLETELKAKITQLESLLSKKEVDHNEALNALQTQLTEANAAIQSKVGDVPAEPEKPVKKLRHNEEITMDSNSSWNHSMLDRGKQLPKRS